MRVLLVEDDTSIAEPVGDALSRDGAEVQLLREGASAHDLAVDMDLVLLDLGLPDVDGTEVCRRIRSISEVPIIVISARQEEGERVLLLEIGADDYLVKPFGYRELAARMRAVLRRSGANGGPQLVRAGALEVDLRSHRARLDEEELELTPKEFDLLVLLSSEPDRVHGRQDILEAVWDAHWYGPSKTLDVHVASLRRKLGDPGWIETVRGVGYRFVQQ
ncbi:MAG: response regulator transcription factor [Microthrixaceae bacterium]